MLTSRAATAGAAYQAKKRAILQSGLSEPVGYTKEKGEFITAVLGGSG